MSGRLRAFMLSFSTDQVNVLRPIQLLYTLDFFFILDQFLTANTCNNRVTSLTDILENGRSAQMSG